MEPQLRRAFDEPAGEGGTASAGNGRGHVPAARGPGLESYAHDRTPRDAASPEERDTGEDPVAGPELVVRTAGFPVELWTAAGDADLFHEVAGLFREHTDMLNCAHDLAERVSDEVITNPALGKEDRRQALLLRRRLHKGDVPGSQQFAQLAGTEGVPSDVGEQLYQLALRAEQYRERYERDREWVAAERARVLPLAWLLLRADPAGRAFLEAEASGLCTEVQQRLDASESWSSKRLRHRADYLWRIVARGAAKTTPRSWLGHVAPLGVRTDRVATGQASSRRGVPRIALGEVTTESVENLHALRSRLDGISLRDADERTPVALASLRLPTDAEFHCFSLDNADPTRMREVRLRNTAALQGVVTMLRDGARPLSEVCVGLLGQNAAEEQLRKIRGFLAHLQELGVLRICAPPRRWLGDQETFGDAQPDGPAGTDSDPDGCVHASRGGGSAEPRAAAAFVDVHRTVTADANDGGLVDNGQLTRLASALTVAERLASLRENDRQTQRMDLSAFLSTEPRRSTDVLKSLLSAEVDLSALRQRESPGWHVPNGRDVGYGRLLDDIRDRLDHTEVDISDERLDELAAPAATERTWPVDALLRPVHGARHDAVLGVSAPAGSLDARFADTFAAVHGRYRNAERYRGFLGEVERGTGARFVELLFPPSHERAANAVCRPIYTSAWTGDTDRNVYHREANRDSDSEYVPLDRILLCGTDQQIAVQTDDGTPLLPVYHATRPPLPPYDLLLHLLLAGGPTSAMRMTRLDRLVRAFPEAEHVPRLTVAGSLVVAPETWRIGTARLWDPADSDMVKMHSVVELRRALGIPRWVFVSPESDGKAVPVDLDAVPGLRTVERIANSAGDGEPLLFEEMVPDPNHLSAFGPDVGNGSEHAAELLVRFPHEQGVRSLARRAANNLQRQSLLGLSATRA